MEVGGWLWSLLVGKDLSWAGEGRKVQCLVTLTVSRSLLSTQDLVCMGRELSTVPHPLHHHQRSFRDQGSPGFRIEC